MLTLNINSITGNEKLKQFFKDEGYTLSDEVMNSFDRIDQWRNWYKGYDPDFHTYKIYNGMKDVHLQKKTMQMAKRVSEDWANMLANEKIQINVLKGQDDLDDWIKENDLIGYLNTMVEKGMALGMSALCLTLGNIKIKGEEADLTQANTKLAIFDANQIYPLSYDEKHIYECAFVSSSYEDGKNYIWVTIHKLEETYKIVTYKLENGDTLKKESTYEFDTLGTVPYFSIFKPNINENQVEAPAGQSIFANALDNLQGIDTIYDGFINEFSLGRMRLFLDTDLTRVDDDGTRRPAVDFNENIYLMLPRSGLDPKNSITEYAPALRTQSYIESLQENLNFLSISCGLGSGFYVAKNIGTALTATAIYAGNQDLYRSTKKHEKAINRVVRSLLKAVDACPFTGVNFDIDSLGIVFDDSVIEDKEAEKNADMKEVNAGLMSKVEYRMKWYGETEEEATASIKSINDSVTQVLE